jgi:flavorubredoxin
LPIYRLFAVVNPIRDRGKLASSFGSYGWSGEAVKIIDANLRALKLNVAIEGLSGKFDSNSGKTEEFIEFGKKISEKMSIQQITI